MTTAVQTPLPVESDKAGGQVNVGACASLMLTRKVQVRLVPAASVTSHCTVVSPFWKVEVRLFPLAVGAVPRLTQTGWPAGRGC